jgi:hypothetical protein
MDICNEAGFTQEQIIIDGLNEIVEGYLINDSKTAKEILLELQSAYFFDIVEVGNKLKFLRPQKSLSQPLSYNDLVLEESTLRITRDCSSNMPNELKLIYIDKDNNFQNGIYVEHSYQSNSNDSVTIKLNLVCQKSLAAKIAKLSLLKQLQQRNKYYFRLPFKYLYLEPSNLIILKDSVQSYHLKIASIYINNDFSISITAIDQIDFDFQYKYFFEPNLSEQINSLPDFDHLILDIPPIWFETNASDRVFIALWSKNNSFKPAAIYFSLDNEEYKFLDIINHEATIGILIDDLNDSQISFVDWHSKFRVSTINGKLESIEFSQLFLGKNFAVINEEVIQFINAKLISSNLYEISGIIRGQNLTEHKVTLQKIGSKFILLNENLARISIPSYLKNQIIKYKITFDNQLLDLLDSHSYKYEMQGGKEPSPVNINVIKHGSIISITWQLRSLNSAFWRNQFTDIKVVKT